MRMMSSNERKIDKLKRFIHPMKFTRRRCDGKQEYAAIVTMKLWSRGAKVAAYEVGDDLGVRCGYCHIGSQMLDVGYCVDCG